MDDTRLGTDGRRYRLIAAIVLFSAITPAVLLVAPAVAIQLAHQLHLGPADIGYMFTAELGGMGVATLPGYWWTTHVNWGHVASGAFAVFVVCNVLSGLLVNSFAALIVLRLISGLAGGTFMVLSLMSAARLRNTDRVFGMWVIGQLVLGALGLLFLPHLFAFTGLAVLYYIMAALMVILTPLVWAFYHVPGKSEAAAVNDTRGGKPERAHSVATEVLVVILGAAVVLLFYVSLGGVWTFVGQIGEKQAGLSPDSVGSILSIATVVGIVGALVPTWIGNRGKRLALATLGYLLMAGSVALLYGAPMAARFVVATMIFKFGWTFLLPFILAVLAEVDRHGHMMNSVNLVIGGGLAIGPTLAGWLIAAGGFNLLSVVSALIVLCSLALIVVVHRIGRPQGAPASLVAAQ